MEELELNENHARDGMADRRLDDELASEAMFEKTARLEATFAPGAGLEALFAVEQALDLAWPAAAPACELIWATEEAREVLSLRAFDEAGRLLLAQAYRGEGLKHG